MDDELLRALARTHRSLEPSDQPMRAHADTRTDRDGILETLIAPLDADERASVLDNVFAKIDAGTAAHAEAPIAIAKPSRGRTVGVLAVAVAIAAVLVLWLAQPRGGGGGPELPSYALTELRGGAAEVRSDPGAIDRVLALQPGDSIALVLTPATATAGPLVVDLVAQAPGKPDVMARVDAQIAKSGAVRIEGPLDRFLALEPGEWQIWAVVSPADRAPTDAAAALDDASVRRVGFRVRLAAP